jgi:hypothetical protein
MVPVRLVPSPEDGVIEQVRQDRHRPVKGRLPKGIPVIFAEYELDVLGRSVLYAAFVSHYARISPEVAIE